MNTFKKSSTAVPLLLLGGGVLLTGCSGESYGAKNPSRGETRYDYANRANCVADWGESQCASNPSGSGFYHVYRREAVAKDQSQTRAVRVVRGGFGGSSKSSSS